MDSDSATLTAWSFGLVGAVYLAFGLSMLRQGYWRPPRNWAGLAFLGALGATSLWGWATFVDVQRGDPPALAAGLADLLRYGFWFAFLQLLIRPQGANTDTSADAGPRNTKTLAGMGWALLAAALAAHAAALLAPGQFGPGTVPLSSMALSIFGLVLLEQMVRNLDQDSHWNAKPISLALAGTFAFDTYAFSQAVIFNSADADANSIRGALHALMAPLLLVTSVRQRDWIARLRVSRRAAFYSATLLICGAYLLFIAAVGYYVRFFGGDWGKALQIGLVFLSLVLLAILALSGGLRAKLRVLVSKNFFNYQYDYRDEWLKFTGALSSRGSPQEVGQQVIRGLGDLVESPGGALWMREPGASQFRQTAQWNIASQVAAEDAGSGLCRFLAQDGRVFNLAEFRSVPRRYGAITLPAWLSGIPKAWLVVPLISGDDMIGFVVLLSPRTAVDTNWEVYDLLKTAGRQAASFLAQMVATEALLEVRKFDAFNRMSAFVVHDLKNIVTQLSLMLQNAKRLHANPEFQQDMLITVENSLEKMRQLMTQLREGSTPAGTAFGVDLEGVSQRVRAAAALRGRDVEVQVDAAVSARGDEARFERIIGHMVHNALDATEASDVVRICLDRLGGQARIVIFDTGHGMSEDFVRDRLFKPFQSTKPTGMGIGAYESFQYVQALGGKVLVDSAPGRGTTVTMLVPLFDASTGSDLDVLQPRH